MEKKNIETMTVLSYYGNVIDEVIDNHINENTVVNEDKLVCELSETIENKIKEELSFVSEGYISIIIGESFEKIDYRALIYNYLGYNS